MPREVAVHLTVKPVNFERPYKRINDLQKPLMIEWSRGTRPPAGAVSSLVCRAARKPLHRERAPRGRSASRSVRQRRIVSLSLVGDGSWDARRGLGCRYGFPRESVGALRDGRGCGDLTGTRTTADPHQQGWLRTLTATLPLPGRGTTARRSRSGSWVPLDGTFRTEHNTA